MQKVLILNLDKQSVKNVLNSYAKETISVADRFDNSIKFIGSPLGDDDTFMWLSVRVRTNIYTVRASLEVMECGKTKLTLSCKSNVLRFALFAIWGIVGILLISNKSVLFIVPFLFLIYSLFHMRIHFNHIVKEYEEVFKNFI